MTTLLSSLLDSSNPLGSVNTSSLQHPDCYGLVEGDNSLLLISYPSRVVPVYSTVSWILEEFNSGLGTGNMISL